MSRYRTARTGLLVLLLLIAAAAWVYRNLDAILERQVRQALLDYGVTDYRLDAPRLSRRAFTARMLWVRGTYGGHGYEITLDAPAVRYDWRILLTRRARSISLSGLDIAVNGTGPTSGQEPDTGPIVLAMGGLLPRELLAALPADTLEIGDLHVAYRAPELPDIDITGQVRYGERLDALLQGVLAGGHLAVDMNSGADPASLSAHVTLARDDGTVAHASAELQPLDGDLWEWHLRGDTDLAALLAWLRSVAATTSILPATALPEGLVLAGRGEFDARVRHPDHLLVDTGRGLAAFPALEASLHVVTGLEQLDYPGVVSGVAGSVDATAGLEQGKLRLVVAPTRLSGQLAAGLPADTGFALEDLALEATLTPGEPAVLDTRLGTKLDLRLHKQKLPRLAFELTQRGTLRQSALAAGLSDAGGTLDASLTGTLDLVAGRGEVDLGVRSGDLKGLTGAIPPSLGITPAGLKIESGAFTLDSRIATPGYDPAGWTQASELSVTGVSGLYRDYRFDALSLNAGWKGIREWQTVRPLSLSLGHLDMGFAISDIAARASLPRPTPINRPAVSLEAFSAHLFGGEASLAEPVAWDFGAAGNTLTLRARQWQLAQIVAVQQNEDIRAQGVLEGELPLAVTDGRIVIKQGYLRALPPGGRIQYLANDASRALGANSGELDLALRLLSDFRYEVLSSTVALDPSGTLLLGLSLAGHNPGQYEGRKVNFNINLEQNLDPLLQSLRLSGKLTDRIEDRLR